MNEPPPAATPELPPAALAPPRSAPDRDVIASVKRDLREILSILGE